jgi:Fe-S-cluster containining protein
MKLNVLDPAAPAAQSWYADGLNFTCSQCGNCCTGGPGYVWITKEEIVRLAEHLKITPEETVEKYCRKIDGRFSLKERRNSRGEYDCVFLGETKSNKKAADGQMIAMTHRTCGVYPVRPLQCRTWPFWAENLRSRQRWSESAKRCHGMNHGRHFSVEQIHAVRDATDWPDNPPTSKK